MSKRIMIESIEERPIDRDYNRNNSKRITQYEIYGDGISYCVRGGYVPEIIIVSKVDEK